MSEEERLENSFITVIYQFRAPARSIIKTNLT